MKACPLYPLFPIMAEVLDGSTASGLFEARLGHEHFGPNKEIHVFCPAYTDGEIEGLLALGRPVHFYFNSVRQIEMFEPRVRKADGGHHIGLRINPRLSVTSYEKYNPCRRGSHLGVPIDELDSVPWEKIDIIHAHALCENMADASKQLIEKVSDEAADYIKKVKYVNFGGGHFMTHPDYDREILINALLAFREKFPGVQPVLEPGGAVVRGAGYIVSTVIDVVDNDGVMSAVLDSSPNCHVPDVMKAGVRLDVIGAGEENEKKYSYALVARTCMARDLWGIYSFDAPLKAGDRVVFADGLQYSLGEANWFNGHPRPSLGMIGTDGKHRLFHAYSYDDFKLNCG
jgi:carboxynorspermidine decarboxylase